jgi:uncharacterized protein YycO
MAIETGDLIFVRDQPDLISRLICWFTGSRYSHVGMIYQDDLIYEINLSRQLAIYPNRYKHYDIYRYKKGLTHLQKIMLQDQAAAEAKVNEGYDLPKIFEFALMKWIKKPFVLKQNKKKICSEIVDNLYLSIGIDLVPERINGDVRPVDLVKSSQLKRIYSYDLR